MSAVRPALVPVLALAALAVAPGSALADAPARTAWFSALSAGGTAAPAPSAQPGDLRVAGTGERPTAYAALLLESPGATGGTLTVVLRSAGTGTVALALCPTRERGWKAGGNQAFDDGPGYDCAAASTFGVPRADGLTVDFTLDEALATGPGSFDVALVPDPQAASPFTVDVQAPTSSAFQPEVPADPAPDTAPDAEPPAEPPAPPSSGTDAGAGSEDAGGTGSSGTVPLPPVTPDLALPEAAPVAEAPAPELAGTDVPPVEPEAAPLLPVPAAVLPPATLAAGNDAAPAGPRLLALLALAAVSAGAGYVASQRQSEPRLLGGRARQVGSASLVAAAAPPAALPPGEQPRGIGRFSRLRDAPPRRLR